MNWQSAFWEIWDVGNKYYLIAGLFFVIWYVLFRRRWDGSKIQPAFPRRKDYFREIVYSTVSIVLFAIPPVVLLQSDQLRPYTRFYPYISEWGWAYFFAVFPLLFLIHDTYFYWLHRLMHQPKLFRVLHLVHHRSVNPSPWAAYAFHPLEAFLESLIFVIFLFALPVNGWHLFVFFVVSLTYNVYGHLGWELYPDWFSRHWFGRWVNTSVCHNQHHRYFKGNYGLYFLFWDRLMGTLRDDYDAQFVAVTRNKEEVSYER
jgi:sterol desaturase/sphingolipid hydroxylase (fatty acid hydroxylase superfamily)